MGATKPVTDETFEAGVLPSTRTVSTPWRDRVVAPALRQERRAFVLRNGIGA
jgi:hypothetical protein